MNLYGSQALSMAANIFEIMVHAGMRVFVGMGQQFVTHGHQVGNGFSQGNGEALLEAPLLLLQQLQDVLLMPVVLLLHKCKERDVCSTDIGVQ